MLKNWKYKEITQSTRILNYFGGYLTKVYCNHKWDKVRFIQSIPKSFWKSEQNRRDALEQIGKLLKIKSYEDWYSIKVEDVLSLNLRGIYSLLKTTNNSLSKLISETFKEFEFKPWKFSKVTSDFWKEKSNQRLFLQDLAKQLNYSNLEDFYRISYDDISHHGGSALLNLYEHSPSKVISSVFEEYDWKLWKFENTPNNYWIDEKNQKNFLESLAKHIEIIKNEDWYRVSLDDFIFFGGKSLLQLYKNNPYRLFQQLIPSHTWIPWKFVEIPLPNGFWKISENVNEYLDWLSKQLHIVHLKDWNRVSVTDLKRFGGSGLLNCYGSFGAVLQKYKPEAFALLTEEKNCQFKNQKLIFSLTRDLLQESIATQKDFKIENKKE